MFQLLCMKNYYMSKEKDEFPETGKKNRIGRFNLLKILSSYRTMMALLALYAITMAIATFIEKNRGAEFVKTTIYYSLPFILLHYMLVINFVMITIKHNLLKSRKWGLLLVHFSFIVILLGALITHIFGREGILHLREGDISAHVHVQTSHGHRNVMLLPFHVELVKFTLTRYPGSTSPSSYESELLVHIDGTTRHERVYMNNVLDIKGYRFFQASYDADEEGTVLSVNKDVAGRTVTYAGYILLFIGSILCLTGRNGRIRTLYRQLNNQNLNHVLPNPTESIKNQKSKIKNCLIALLLCFSGQVMADVVPESMSDAVQHYVVSPAHAKRFGSLTAQSTNGRMIPVNTFSSEILRKLYRDTKIGRMNSDQFLLSLLTLPEMWMHVPLVTYSNDEVANYFSLPRKKCAYLDFFRDDGTYKLQIKLNEAYRKTPSERTAFDRDILKLDEQANILHQLFDYQMLHLFPKPDDPQQKWYAPGDDLSEFSGMDSVFVSRIFPWYLSEVQNSLHSGDWSKPNEVLDMILTYQTAKNNVPEFDLKKIALELKYNRLDFFWWSKFGYLLSGGLLLIFSFLLFLGIKPLGGWIVKLSGAGVLLVFLFHTAGMGMRWLIAGYAPWSNSYETMVFLSWAAVFAGLLFARRSPVTFSLATLFAGVILLVSGMNWMNPQISPLVPVLKSPWLMYHVAVLMAAYGFFGIGFLIGLFNLCTLSFFRREKLTDLVRELTIITEIALIVGLILMTVGSFMGAVWANESWGRYWGWDPKETWALITIIVYAMVTHLHLARKWYSLRLFNLCSVLAFASVLMTYFGVNYLLSGMHSYG